MPSKTTLFSVAGVGVVVISIASIILISTFDARTPERSGAVVVDGISCSDTLSADYLGEAFERGVSLGMPTLGLDAYAIHQGRRKVQPTEVPACTIMHAYPVNLTVGTLLPGVRTIITVMHNRDGVFRRVVPEVRYFVVLHKKEMAALTREFGSDSLRASVEP